MYNVNWYLQVLKVSVEIAKIVCHAQKNGHNTSDFKQTPSKLNSELCTLCIEQTSALESTFKHRITNTRKDSPNVMCYTCITFQNACLREHLFIG